MPVSQSADNSVLGSQTSPARRPYVRVPKHWLAVAVVMLVVPWFFVLNATGKLRHSSHAPKTLSTKAAAAQGVTPPWGRLEVVPIQLEPPLDFAEKFLVYSSATWYLPGSDRSDAMQAMDAAGVPATLREEILSTLSASPDGRGLVVKPSTQTILALPQKVKASLYDALAGDGRNYSKLDPFRTHIKSVNQWLSGAGSDATIAMVKNLMYTRGDVAIFADASVVLDSLKSEGEKVRLLRTLARQNALHVRLLVSPDTDVKAVAEYWSAGKPGRAHALRPLIESLTKVPGGCTIDVTALLPVFARRRLYQYPDASGATANSPLDCHWSSMNFSNDPPDDRLSEPPYVAEKLAEQYRAVEPPYQMGDVMFLSRGNSQAIHSAVYIAEDIVFTKNGGTITSPWMLMRLNDLLAYYRTHGELRVLVFRRNF